MQKSVFSSAPPNHFLIEAAFILRTFSNPGLWHDKEFSAFEGDISSFRVTSSSKCQDVQAREYTQRMKKMGFKLPEAACLE